MTEKIFQFLIKGYLARGSARLHIRNDSFNSSLKDTGLLQNFRPYTANVFQFLIKGYLKRFWEYNLSILFQFLIKGYPTQKSRNSAIFRPFNSSLKDTSPDKEGVLIPKVIFQFLIKGYRDYLA